MPHSARPCSASSRRARPHPWLPPDAASLTSPAGVCFCSYSLVAERCLARPPPAPSPLPPSRCSLSNARSPPVQTPKPRRPLSCRPAISLGIKEGWYDGASIAFAVLLVVVVTATSDYKQSFQFQKAEHQTGGGET